MHHTKNFLYINCNISHIYICKRCAFLGFIFKSLIISSLEFFRVLNTFTNNNHLKNIHACLTSNYIENEPKGLPSL